MNFFAFFLLAISCFSSVEAHFPYTGKKNRVAKAKAEAKARVEAERRALLVGNGQALSRHCFGDLTFVASRYGADVAEKCRTFAAKRRVEHEAWKQGMVESEKCRKVAGCGYDDHVTCTENVLRECGNEDLLLHRQKRCIEKHDALKEAESMSNWFGPLKWFRVQLITDDVKYFCGTV